MSRKHVTADWHIELENDFQRRADGGEVMFWLPPRTVYATVFTSDVDPEEAIADLLQRRAGTPVRTFDRLEPGLVGHAYLLPEGEGRQGYWGLNTWTATRGSVACVTFYFDGMDDLDWALRAWHSVRREASGRRYVN